MSKIRNKTVAALAFIAIGSTLGAGLAQAHTDVRWSVSIGVPALPVYAQPVAPVYLAPAPVVYAPPPPPPRPVYVQPVPVGYGYGYGYGQAYRYPSRWDRDADGVPDRYEHRGWRHGDRDHDRDGVPDRHDRRPADPWRH